MTEELTFHVPPRNQGQMVEVAYAADFESNVVIQRVHDQSDRSVAYYISDMMDDDGDYWNGAPPNKRWRMMTNDERQRYRLV